MIHLRTILQPTDFSGDSLYALEVASALARDQAARVIMLHVLPQPIPGNAEDSIPPLKAEHAHEDLEAYRREINNELIKLRESAPWAEVESRLEEGDAAAVIARTADETACDVIILGTHGRTDSPRRGLGSVAAKVARTVSCPVITVRNPQPALATRTPERVAAAQR